MCFPVVVTGPSPSGNALVTPATTRQIATRLWTTLAVGAGCLVAGFRTRRVDCPATFLVAGAEGR